MGSNQDDINRSRSPRSGIDGQLWEGRPTTLRSELDEGALSPQMLDITRQVRARGALEEADELLAEHGRDARPRFDGSRRAVASFESTDQALRDPDFACELSLSLSRCHSTVAQARTKTSRDRVGARPA